MQPPTANGRTPFAPAGSSARPCAPPTSAQAGSRDPEAAAGTPTAPTRGVKDTEHRVVGEGRGPHITAPTAPPRAVRPLGASCPPHGAAPWFSNIREETRHLHSQQQALGFPPASKGHWRVPRHQKKPAGRDTPQLSLKKPEAHGLRQPRSGPRSSSERVSEQAKGTGRGSPAPTGRPSVPAGRPPAGNTQLAAETPRKPFRPWWCGRPGGGEPQGQSRVRLDQLGRDIIAQLAGSPVTCHPHTHAAGNASQVPGLRSAPGEGRGAARTALPAAAGGPGSSCSRLAPASSREPGAAGGGGGVPRGGALLAPALPPVEGEEENPLRRPAWMERVGQERPARSPSVSRRARPETATRTSWVWSALLRESRGAQPEPHSASLLPPAVQRSGGAAVARGPHQGRPTARAAAQVCVFPEPQNQENGQMRSPPLALQAPGEGVFVKDMQLVKGQASEDACALSHGPPACPAGLGHEKEPNDAGDSSSGVKAPFPCAVGARRPLAATTQERFPERGATSKSRVSPTRLHGHTATSIQDRSGEASSREGARHSPRPRPRV